MSGKKHGLRRKGRCRNGTVGTVPGVPEEEAFAGDGSIRIVEATGCNIRARASAGCENLEAAILTDCSTEEDSFDPEVILCLDRIESWHEHRFVVQDQSD